MDPVTLAASAVTALAPYLSKLVESAADKIGESIPAGVVKLWSWVRKKLSDKPAAEAALQDIIANPSDLDNQAALRKEVRKLVESDGVAAKELVELLKSLPAGDQIIQTQSITGSIVQGSVTQIGKQSHD